MSIEENLITTTDTKAKNFSETNLFIEQDLNNSYVKSKFVAEKLVLENIPFGLNAIILRLGNITSRYSDGVFQKNISENAFLNRLDSFLKLGTLPDYLLNTLIEFTPVDLCADAILKIAHVTNIPYNVFHIYNHNHISISQLIEFLNELNIPINIANEKEFEQIIVKNSHDNINILSGFINDINKDKKINYGSNIKIKNTFSVEFLKRIGFEWKEISNEYIKKYISYLIKINFIN